MADDELAAQVAADGDDDAIRSILQDVCRVTQMGFAAVARVTDQRWIAAQVLDQVEFGLNPGDELSLKTTICNEIRETGQAIVIDHVSAHPVWRQHDTPALYGFESYVSIPVRLDDGSFYGTLCAIDSEPRRLSATATIAALELLATRLASLLSGKIIGAAEH